MKSFAPALVTLSLVVAFQAAHAGAPTAPSLPRAEVLADLDAYQQSGLYLLDVSDMSPLTVQYQSARQRYEDLRASPRFAELVRKYEAHGAERATLASR
ncbi:hypothetical protein [Azohydromonas australica]|uniref:hypothetical protein n=1 Tax=Azohydromonas australica TaxID=364039 RepID=UPI00048CA4B2|nr:hypothetical protein [Azohydromonas australica]